MRHKVFGRKLGRDINQRSALLQNLSSAVLLFGYVVTTQSKAKFAKGYIEKLIKNSQKKSLATKREIASRVSSAAFDKLIKEISPAMAGRSGGYTRIIRLSKRRGDDAQMVKLELVDLGKTPTKIKSQPAKEVKKNK